MKFLTQSECLQWAVLHGYSVEKYRPSANRRNGTVDFSIPEDAGARVFLCKVLWDLPGESYVGERLLWTTEPSIWPTGEHLPLETRFRQALGETRSLDDAPGCICAADETDDGISWLVLNCVFLWDCWVLSASGANLFLSHDEYGYCYSPDPEARDAVFRHLRHLELLR